MCVSVPEWADRGGRPYDYLVCVNRAERPPRLLRRCIRGGVREIDFPGSAFRWPSADPDVPLDLQAALARVYDMGSYRDRIDYGAPCRPPLSEEDQAWADELVKQSASSG